MPKGIPNRKYPGEFKQKVVETMRKEQLGYMETADIFELHNQGKNGYKRVQKWERIYLEEGAEGLYVERRGRGGKGRSVKLDQQVEDDLIAENQ